MKYIWYNYIFFSKYNILINYDVYIKIMNYFYFF